LRLDSFGADGAQPSRRAGSVVVMQVTVLSGIGVATALALFAAQFPRRGLRAKVAAAPALLTNAAYRRPPRDLPAPATLRKELVGYLEAPQERGEAVIPHEPETAAQARRRVFGRILRTWNAETVHQLNDRQLQALWLLRELISATPCRAGELAQRFRRPDMVLAIRDQMRAIDARRQRFERQRDAFRATTMLWEQLATEEGRALVDALRAMTAPDPDLWHKVIAEHDLADPAQARAALWCARQPDCERASVALYLSRIAEAGRITSALRHGETAWLDGLGGVIRDWNAGRYTGRRLGLAPADAASRAASALSSELDRLAEQTGRPRWPDPTGIFVAYHGASPRPRDNWDLRAGRMTAPPRIEHFIETA
jgi:hypothetical protein